MQARKHATGIGKDLFLRIETPVYVLTRLLQYLTVPAHRGSKLIAVLRVLVIVDGLVIFFTENNLTA
jgi:hypothetical protein